LPADAKGHISRFCGDPVRENNSLKPILLIFISLAGFAVGLRILARVLTQAFFWWDDVANFLAMVRSQTLHLPSAQD
jgi:hypothetical protein